MKKSFLLIRKLIIIIFFVGFLFLSFNFTNIKINGANEASFEITGQLEKKSLIYGVSYRSVAGLSNTGNSTTKVKQVCNAIEIPSVEGLVVTSWANMSPNKWNMSHVNAVARNYEETHPGYKVIAAVNGDFYDINAEKNFARTPTGCEISDGNFYKSTPTRSNNYQVVSFTNDGSKNSIVAYNQSVVKVNSLPTLAIYDENDQIIAEYQINKVNAEPGANEISVFYPTYGSDKKAIAQAVPSSGKKTFAISKAIYSLPHKANDFYGLGEISASSISQVTEGQFALSSNNDEINSKLDLGVKVRVQYEWNGDAANVKDAVNAGTQVLVNGAIASNANSGDGNRMSARHPRTAVGVKDDGTIVLMVNDGRQENLDRYGSYGDELAAMMREFGCVDAFNLDGGGSSILYYLDGDELVLGNKYSDASERSISNIVLVAVKEIEVDLKFQSIGSRNVDVEVKLLDGNRHNIKELYVKADTKQAVVEDGVAHLTSLSQLTRYTLQVVYLSANGRMVYTTLTYDFATTAKEYKIKGLEVVDKGDTYEVTLNYSDSGKSTKLSEAKIAINGKEYTLSDSKVVIAKADFDIIHELVVTFEVNTIDGYVVVSLVNPHAPFINDLKDTFTKYNDLINQIYG